MLIAWIKLTPDNLVYRERNFYGIARVQKEGNFMVLYHGHTSHGQECLSPGSSSAIPADLYYSPAKAIIDFIHQSKKCTISIGAIGLGVGMITPYAKAGDTIVFYELDPKIEKIARKYFSYISRAQAQIKIIVGDGRFTLSKLPSQQYDFMFIDAFNSDSIPSHLLTQEALTVYLKHLKLDGFLAFHITNNYVDLQPVLANLARQNNLASCYLYQGNSSANIVMARNAQLMDQFITFIRTRKDNYSQIDACRTVLRPNLGVWTDDYVSLFSVLKLHR